ncbi:hypothetical protein [Rummeliibacillus pycnus]|uniref:hypothetical protein n=1 Tax=Rummeliibacillus pycnus TaxID=101070 RepID=UPI0037CB918B
MEFYVLKDTDEKGFRIAYWNQKKTIKYICEICGGINSQNEGPLVISFEGKGKLADYYRIVKWHTVSPKFIKVLVENKITGIQFKDVLIDDEKGNLLTTDLKQLDIYGRCGLLTDLNGEEICNCRQCHRVVPGNLSGRKGLSVNLDKWDGSDMFYFDNWEGNIIVTEKVKELIERNNYPNIYFVNIRSYKFIW